MTSPRMVVQRSSMETLERLFRSRVSAFLGRSGLSPMAFGEMAVGDPNLMRPIGRGRSPSLRTADRILGFIAEQDGASGGGRDPPRRPLAPETDQQAEHNEEEQDDDREREE